MMVIATLASKRDGHGDDDAGERRVYTRLEHRHPHDDADENVGRDARDAAQVERDKHPTRQRRDEENCC